MDNSRYVRIETSNLDKAMLSCTITVSSNEDGEVEWYYVPPQIDWYKVKVSLSAEEMEAERTRQTIERYKQGFLKKMGGEG